MQLIAAITRKWRSLKRLAIASPMEPASERELEPAENAAAQLSRFVTESHDVIYATNAEGQWTFLNPAWEALTGHSVATSLGEQSSLHVHPEDWEVVLQAVEQLQSKQHSAARTTLRYCHADGSAQNVEVICQSVYDANGAFTGVRGRLHNITDRCNAEAALAQSEARFRKLADLSPAAIFECNASGAVSYINPAYSALIGLTIEQAFGDGWRKEVNPESISGAIAHWSRVVAGEQVEPFEIGYRNGRWGMVVFSQLADTSDGEKNFLGAIVDVTEYRAATIALRVSQAQLAASEARYRALVESASDAMVDIDPDGVCRYISPSVEIVAGLEASQFLDLPFDRHTHPEDVGLQQSLLRRLTAGPEAFGTCQYRCIDANGQTRWIEANLHSKRSQSGDLAGFIGAIRDVTDIISVVAELELLQDPDVLGHLPTLH